MLKRTVDRFDRWMSSLSIGRLSTETFGEARMGARTALNCERLAYLLHFLGWVEPFTQESRPYINYRVYFQSLHRIDSNRNL